MTTKKTRVNRFASTPFDYRREKRSMQHVEVVPELGRNSKETKGTLNIERFTLAAFVRRVRHHLQQNMPNARTVLPGNRKKGIVLHIPLVPPTPNHNMPEFYLRQALEAARADFDPILQGLAATGLQIHSEKALIEPKQEGHLPSYAIDFILHAGEPRRPSIQFQSISASSLKVRTHDRPHYANR